MNMNPGNEARVGALDKLEKCSQLGVKDNLIEMIDVAQNKSVAAEIK